ncbi:MAG: hydrogenase formation protein HypD [Oligoflexia bacterium]|nr:hydrogenase formation protein HypD [Oligoflexia bacterium]
MSIQNNTNMNINKKDKIALIKRNLEKISKTSISIMEVCGTHTMSIAKFGIRSLLPPTINIISGPGCPVCVTSATDIKTAIDMAKMKDVIVATFGDMLKIPSQGDSLQNYSNVKIVYSPLDALTLAQKNKDKHIIFLGIGFETTTPLIAATILNAHKMSLTNFSVLSMHKLVPPALTAILKNPEHNLHAFILPGHVSVITGSRYFNFLKEFKINGVISGFDDLEIMESIYIMVHDFENGIFDIKNNYSNVVSEDGNQKAFKTIFDVFEIDDSEWRGIGIIPGSGLKIKGEFANFDAIKRFDYKKITIDEAPGCICGNILLGKAKPTECNFFEKHCTPSTPIGPCMVSSEGTCAAYFKYFL